MRLFGVILKNSELLADTAIERLDPVWKSSLLKKDRDFVPIRRSPIVKINHRLFLLL